MTRVWLQSGGGLVDDGFKIGRMLRQHHAVTVVGQNDVCASSCAIAFLGGSTRLLLKDKSTGRSGRLIFHAPYVYVNNSIQINCDKPKVNDYLRTYYRAMLGSSTDGDRLYNKTMRYCSTEDGWTINQDAALMYKITNCC